MKKFKRQLRGGILGLIGFLLSPLSWWNDLFVNVPLALAFAWLVSLPFPRAFAVTFVVAYWLTNVLGFVLMHKGAKEMLSDEPPLYQQESLVKDVLISVLYTLLILGLLKLKWIEPLPNYFPQR